MSELNGQQSQKMLPDGWHWAKLGEVCDFLDSRRIPVNDSERVRRIAGKAQSDLYPYYGANGQVGWIDSYIFDEPLVLLAEDGGNFGSSDRPIAYAVSGRYWVNNHAHVLRPRDGIDFDYCLHALRIRPDVGSLVSGSTRAKLNKETASRIPIPLPPLAEQQRIAAILTEQMAAVEKARAATEAQLQAAKILPASYLREVFESAEAKHWPKKRLGNHVTKIGSGVTPSGGQASYLAAGVPLIRSQNVHMNRFEPSGLAYISEAQDKIMNGSRVQKGDVLLNITGASIGRVCVAPPEMCPANVNQHVSIIRSDGSFEPSYLSFFISQPHFQKHIMGSQAGATRQALTKSLIEGFEIPFPDIQMQRQIVDLLNKKMESIDSARHALAEQLKAINHLPGTMLKQAFSGKL